MWRCFLPFLALVLVVRAADTGPWDVSALQQVPQVEFGARDGLTQEVLYQGEPFAGKPTRVFAYLGRPTVEGRAPAMLLVHGGGGHAFKDWATYWARRGYVALAMDVTGHGAGQARLPDGGPDETDAIIFRSFTAGETREMWSYHAVAAVVRGHSLLASLPEVDRDRIGITGISWGGYLTGIVAGIDHRLKVAVPVYGCGFLGDNSHWKEPILDKMPPDQRALWLRAFDPSSYLAGVRCPILFLNGTNDFAYPLDSHCRSSSLVPDKLRYRAVKPGLPHGHYWNFGEVDAFVDWALKKDGPPPPVYGPPKQARDSLVAPLAGVADGAKHELHFTTDNGPWQKRQWQTIPAEYRDQVVSAPVPKERPTVAFFSTVDTRGLTTSSTCFEFDKNS